MFTRLFQHPAGQEAKALLYTKFINIDDFDAEPHKHAHNSGRRGLALLLCACANASESEVVGTEQVDKHDPANTEGFVSITVPETFEEEK